MLQEEHGFGNLLRRMHSAMPEGKKFKLTIQIEQTLYALIMLIANEKNQSISQYIRTCVIKDLESRGLLTKEVLMRLAV